ncbi:MAG TPA: hypothetical protein VL172_18475 [Kofleriaceae bacterium]|nr:hypothetical protein [Kofleriaceae bacterium]
MIRILLPLLLTAAVAAPARADGPQRSFAGSVQLDYLGVPTEKVARQQALDGATVELSLKLAMDFGNDTSAAVKVCVACHGLEVGMAYFDLRVADELNVRAGRFTPAFGNFPLRHDPANHRTSDKPLPYDMGRMLRIREWNMSVLPAPWVDNGVEIDGAHFFGDGSSVEYAAYAIGGPRGGSDATDLDFTQSRSPQLYYVDNNSRPSVGARLAGNLVLGETGAISCGLSAMAGHYDPQNQLSFAIAGADLVVEVRRVFLRAEYLIRRTQMSLGDDPESRFRYGPDPSGHYDDFFLKDGFYTELEVPAGAVDLVARFDGMRRLGNVPVTSLLRAESLVVRYTLAAAFRLRQSLRLKTSAELYDFSDFGDEIAIHVGLAGPF